MTIEQLRARRAQLLREADGLRQNGAFPTDEARAQFDAAMAEIDTIDGQIRTLEAAPPAPVPPAAELAAARETAIAQERARVASVTDLCRRHGMEDAFIGEQVTSGASVEAVRAAVLERLATRTEGGPGGGAGSRFAILPGEDAVDKWRRGAANWLLQRSGMADMVARFDGVTVEQMSPGEFRGMTLLDLAKDHLQRVRIDFRGRDRMDIASLAFRSGGPYQTTSHFATLLENTMHKVLRAAYALAPDTWSLWCGIGTTTDFRAHHWYRVGGLSALDAKNEHGEFKNKSIPDGEKASFSVATKGNIIAITRETIVNDDIGSMMQLISRLGRAGKLTIENDVYTMLGLNSGLGPTQADAQPLFHSNRANVNATGSAITVAGIDADRVVMGSQRDVNSVDYLDLRPSVLLVSLANGAAARVINEAQYDPADNKFQKPNSVRGLFSAVVDTPRLSGNRRYLFADPSQHPVFLVSFLEGQREPILDTQDGWRADGVEMRARLDFGVNVVDYRGGVTNAGQ